MADDSWCSVITPFKQSSLDGNDCQQRSEALGSIVVLSFEIIDFRLLRGCAEPIYWNILMMWRTYDFFYGCVSLSMMAVYRFWAIFAWIKKKINLFCFNLMVSYERIFTSFEYVRFEIMTNSAINVLAMGRENARINPSCKNSSTNGPFFLSEWLLKNKLKAAFVNIR